MNPHKTNTAGRRTFSVLQLLGDVFLAALSYIGAGASIAAIILYVVGPLPFWAALLIGGIAGYVHGAARTLRRNSKVRPGSSTPGSS